MRNRSIATASVLLIFISFSGGASAAPEIAPIPETNLLGGSPLHLPLVVTGGNGPTTFTVTSSDDALVMGSIPAGNRSLRVQVRDFGEMVFELFDARVPRATNRIVQLADAGFYDGVIFHRVIDDFVIQGGDPTGTGAGGSELGSFSDQFHVDLQHNRTGLLSMAKSSDDTNDSQFFITEGSQRHLDFNHSIFGLLVTGEDVRERISQVSTGSSDRPEVDVVMESVRSFIDESNGVLMLKAPEGATGAADVTVVAMDGTGVESRRTFRVNVTPDTVNSPPFLADIPDIVTTVDTQVTYQLEARDVEGDAAHFLDQTGLSINGLPVPLVAHQDLQYRVDFDTGLLVITPTNGLSGRHNAVVATAISVDAVDYQIITIVVEP
jgi:cyclophilin family peptidyl-prolyl cis-trans isomerase